MDLLVALGGPVRDYWAVARYVGVGLVTLVVVVLIATQVDGLSSERDPSELLADRLNRFVGEPRPAVEGPVGSADFVWSDGKRTTTGYLMPSASGGTSVVTAKYDTDNRLISTSVDEF